MKLFNVLLSLCIIFIYSNTFAMGKKRPACLLTPDPKLSKILNAFPDLRKRLAKRNYVIQDNALFSNTRVYQYLTNVSFNSSTLVCAETCESRITITTPSHSSESSNFFSEAVSSKREFFAENIKNGEAFLDSYAGSFFNSNILEQDQVCLKATIQVIKMIPVCDSEQFYKL